MPLMSNIYLLPDYAPGFATLNPYHDMTARCRPVGCVGKVEQTQLGLAVHTLGIIHKLYIFYVAKVMFISDLCNFLKRKNAF